MPTLNHNYFSIQTLNPCKIPTTIASAQEWVDILIKAYVSVFNLTLKEELVLTDVMYGLYEQAGVFEERPEDKSCGDWKEEISKRSGRVTFHKIYKKIYKDMESISNSFPALGAKKIGNDTVDAYARLLGRLSCFNRKFSIEYRLLSDEGYETRDGRIIHSNEAFADANSVGIGVDIDRFTYWGTIKQQNRLWQNFVLELFKIYVLSN